MGSYTLLFKGDRLPTVGVLQVLLNRTGGNLTVDGAFGSKTHAALVAFQRQRNMPPDGIADDVTWRRLIFHDALPLVDVFDVFDENLYKKQFKQVQESGGEPLAMGGMSNGLAEMVQMLRSASDIYLLRITGHGCPGVQAITMGQGGWIETVGRQQIRHIYPHETTSLNSGNVGTFPTGALKGIFGPFGSVELHGCHVAHGAAGHGFVRSLANKLGVPVTAGIKSQRSALRFQGPTFTAVPGGLPLSRWCGALPRLVPISVP